MAVSRLPAGFSATVVQEGLGAGRHLAVAANGDIYLASRNGLVAMRDKNGDGKVDETAKFGDVQGTGVMHLQELAVRLGRRRRVPLPVEKG